MVVHTFNPYTWKGRVFPAILVYIANSGPPELKGKSVTVSKRKKNQTKKTLFMCMCVCASISLCVPHQCHRTLNLPELELYAVVTCLMCVGN